MNRVILASKSPRRKELMEKICPGFLCDPAQGEETVPEGLPVTETAEYLSRQKAMEVAGRHDFTDVVIGSDTVVICDGVIFGKPKDREDAVKMLRALSGKTHTVSTGVTIVSGNETESFTSETRVTFYDLTEKEIEKYVNTGEPMDKAGAYGIQGSGALYVKKIEGDYYTVVGFPVAEVYRRLNEKKYL